MVASGHFGSAETTSLTMSALAFLQPFAVKLASGSEWLTPTAVVVVASSKPPSDSEWKRVARGGPVAGCPNVGNEHHECTAYCREQWGVAQSGQDARTKAKEMGEEVPQFTTVV
jgi:hypothetical protein